MAKSSRALKRSKKKTLFVDVFAGCGGLSLGLMNAGWTGRFAIEKNGDAFNTLATNLIRGKKHSFVWPRWLPKKPTAMSTLLANHSRQLEGLRGTIDLLAGAPPCQGFSLAGRRLYADPRNALFRQYLAIVKKVEPKLLLVENVQGFSFPFKKNGRGEEKRKPYSKILGEKLKKLGYTVFSELVDFSEFGVPQSRNRFILVAIKNGDPALGRLAGQTPFQKLRDLRQAFLRSKKLWPKVPISAKQAIADLEVSGKTLVPATDPIENRFKQIRYSRRPNRSRFVRLMRRGIQRAPGSMRLPCHRSATIRQFRRIMATCEQGRAVNNHNRKRLGIGKQALTPLHPRRPASTVTTLPDDIIHYSEPRVLTVRENARLQSFPDWFEFTGQYTTGGKDRRHACPRYTQVGNAVPPLFSEAIGLVLRRLCA